MNPTIEKLKELRAAVSDGHIAVDYNNLHIKDADRAAELLGSLPDICAYIETLERKAQAGEELAEHIEKLHESWCNGEHPGGKCPQDWRTQRDEALKKYREDIG